MLRLWGCAGILILACGCGSSKSDAVPTSSGGSPSAGGASATGGASSCSHGDIQLFATRVSGTVTVNGAPFTGSLSQEDADVILRNAENDYAPLTRITAGNGSYDALVAPGTYDLYYHHTGESALLPGNDFALLRSGVVIGSEPLSLDIDVPFGTVSGTLTIAGAVYSDPTGKNGAAIELYSATSGRTLLGGINTGDGTYEALVIAGSYDALYESTGGTELPRNYQTKVRSGVVVEGGKTLSFDVDVPSTTVTVSLTVNGAPAKNDARLTLQRSSDDAPAKAILEQTAGTNVHSAHVIAGGRYDLFYSAGQVGADVLLNTETLIETGIDIGTAPVSVSVDVAASVVSGKVTLNGAPLSLTDGASLYLKTSAGDSLSLVAPAGSYSALVAPGTYDVYFDGGSAGIADLPATTIKVQSGVVIGASPVSLNIEIPKPTPVSGKITVNGTPINGSPQYSLSVSDGERSAQFLSPTGGEYSALVFPGTYNLGFLGPRDAGELPNNYSILLQTGIVVGTTPLVLDVDIPGAMLSGTVTINGMLKSNAPDALQGARFMVRLPDKSGQTQIANRFGGDAKYTSFLVPGRYELSYATDGSGQGLPSNHNLTLGCLLVE